MRPILLVALGGAIGASLRYIVSTLIASRWALNFPLGTLLVNVSGCLAVGFLLIKGFESGSLSNDWRLFLVVGIGGAFTTFSSFSFETIQLLRDGFYVTAACNALGNLILCLLATISGVMLAQIK